ncbi:MAG: Cystathionine beta-synthase [candidate division TM6 bacterium GW2011_GWF2_28_16]|jgi:cystathionine beta-synthase|nr:MAG: Cystathionine beta-synthase [candidate division TM6 bacterium GW2011_GWF2_28_16]
MNKKYKNILELVGNTPLAHLDFVEQEFGIKATLLAKLEFLNPGGSVKDRSALFMVAQAEKEGLLKPGGTIIEASSGNQGIALAMIGAVKGYKVIITVPDRTSKEKVDALRAYGATVYLCPNTDSLDDPQGYHTKAEILHEQIPGSFMPNQYYNKANSLAHYTTTGKEIWEQTEGKLTHVIVGAGSCGTISGVGKFLKEKNKNIKVIGADAATSAYSSKAPKAYESEGIGIDVITDTFEQQYVDEIIPVSDAHAFSTARYLALKGFLVGISSGAVMHAAIEYCKKLDKNDVVVLTFGDSGRAYLQKLFGENAKFKDININVNNKNNLEKQDNA